MATTRPTAKNIQKTPTLRVGLAWSFVLFVSQVKN